MSLRLLTLRYTRRSGTDSSALGNTILLSRQKLMKNSAHRFLLHRARQHQAGGLSLSGVIISCRHRTSLCHSTVLFLRLHRRKHPLSPVAMLLRKWNRWSTNPHLNGNGVSSKPCLVALLAQSLTVRRRLLAALTSQILPALKIQRQQTKAWTVIGGPRTNLGS